MKQKSYAEKEYGADRANVKERSNKNKLEIRDDRKKGKLREVK